MPTQMRDRWANRAEPAVGHGTVYWHVLMREYPEAVAAASEAQRRLAEFPGFHLPPREWLHMTTYVVGPTADITRQQMSEILDHARAKLLDTGPIPVTIGRVLYHPEAVMLALEPRESLLPVFEAVVAASGERQNSKNETWTPHVTVAYSTSPQDARPIAAALGRSVKPRNFAIDNVSLIVQWGPEREWDWETIGNIPFAASIGKCSPS